MRRSLPIEDVELCGHRCQSVALPQSSRLRTSDHISDGTDRHIQRSCRRMAKNDDSILITRDLINTSASINMPRFRTTAVGAMRSAPTRSNDCGNWCKRRLFIDQITSVFAALNWSWFKCILSATWSIHADRHNCIDYDSFWAQNNNNNNKNDCD